MKNNKKNEHKYASNMTIICEKIWCYMFAEIAKNIGANANIKKKNNPHENVWMMKIIQFIERRGNK